MHKSTARIVICALLVALDVLLSRVLAINTPIMKIGLGFAAVALAGCLYGPWWAAITGALADIVGSLIFPTGAYFPGFTVTAAVTGIIFGVMLYNKKITWKRAVISSVLNVLIVTYILNTAMISYITGTPYITLLKVRAVQILVMLPVEIIVIGGALPVILRQVERFTLERNSENSKKAE